MASDPVLSRQDLLEEVEGYLRGVGDATYVGAISVKVLRAIAQALQEDEPKPEALMTLSTSSSETSAQSWHYIGPPDTASDAALVPRLRELEDMLRESKRGHYYCEDPWYTCPKHPDGCANDNEGTDCNCGADEWNARVEALLAARVREGA